MLEQYKHYFFNLLIPSLFNIMKKWSLINAMKQIPIVHYKTGIDAFFLFFLTPSIWISNKTFNDLRKSIFNIDQVHNYSPISPLL